MKYIAYILLLTLVACSSSKETQKETNFEKFRSEVKRASGNQNELFEKGVLWAASHSIAPHDEIELANQDMGLLIGKGSVSIEPTGSGMQGTIHESQTGHVQFTYRIQFKDNKYKYEFYALSHKANKAGGLLSDKEPDCRWHAMSKKTWQAIKDQAHTKIDKVADVLEKKMGAKGEDW